MALAQFARIADTLEALGRLARRTDLRRAGAHAITVLLTGTGLAIAVAQVGWSRTALGVFLGAAGAAGGLFGRRVWRLRQHPDQDLGPARLAQMLAPELGTAALSAVELAQHLRSPEVRFSRDLAEAHVERTARALLAIDLQARFVAQGRRGQRRVQAMVVGALLAVVVAGLTLRTGRNRLLGLIIDPRAARLSDVPLAGDIRITYHYPAYTGLPARVVEGGDGSIQAVTGTEVELHATADVAVRKALLRLESMTGDEKQDVPMEVSGGRSLGVRLPVLRDGRYHFVLVDGDGDLLEDRQRHPVRALLDEYPEIHLDEPTADVELRDNQVVTLRWRAKDDFGISDVQLVVERDGATEPVKIALTSDTGERREGVYRWSVAELNLQPGKEARFHLEAADNDAIAGPKRSTSVTRRLVVFSARQHHDELMAKERAIADLMVDWLGADLVAPFPPDVKGHATALKAQQHIAELMTGAATSLRGLLSDLREDKLTGRELIAAFTNILEHVDAAQQERLPLLARLGLPAGDKTAIGLNVGTLQRKQVGLLEKDVVYLDDLLAMARIAELKQTAKDLLTAQHDLQSVLQQYKESHDPALKEQLKQRIGDLRQKMLDLLTKMSDIKKNLPGEYRNMESGSMLRMDDQLQRLEKLLQENNLEAAAQELEGLANMVENMVNSINDAEKEYGGVRYKEIREQLAHFAEQFKQLENEQQALSQRTDALLKDYRKKAIERAGSNLDAFVQKARDKTRKALQEIDRVAENAEVARQYDRDLDPARQGLLDLDALLAHRDFAEARQVAQNAELNGESLMSRLQGGAERFQGSGEAQEMADAARAAAHAVEHTHEVAAMLAKLFPDAKQVLGEEAMNQMQRLGRKQQSLEQQAKDLGAKMEQLAGELPLFGGEPRASLDGARSEMGQASKDIQDGELPGGAGHGRRAVDQLGKLREALEQASKGGGQGMPLPIGMPQGQGQEPGPFGDNNREEVEIPKSDKNRAGPRFRQDLMEAAKQKPPAHFEDAVRHYYEELIR